MPLPRDAAGVLPRRVAVLSVHTSPLAQPGTGDAGGMNVYVLQTALHMARRGVEVEIFTRATSSADAPAVTVAPDGSIFAATGYGANIVHKFDATGKLLKSFGSKGTDEKQFDTPHGLAIDTRFGEPRLLVADRAKNRLVHFDLEGNWIGVHASNLRLPSAVSILGDAVAVAELKARVTILDKTGTPVAFLGDNPNKAQWANFGVSPQDQQLGIFTAPHGLSFDKAGNLYVQDWNKTGRITKLTKL